MTALCIFYANIDQRNFKGGYIQVEYGLLKDYIRNFDTQTIVE